ncbi:bifunctional purine biosynthesis protein PurH [Aliidongia dinghuensis]|uniref:Bifunctional purine biosynthesis protein PurH n=1 Tax=Aliidongia dinghuensis TaxID=1867774 RepID=A0A8J3E3K5_9PROT|nr:bifunctional phosphoribosylaminoimidazolecarboxamide formyltransferase/IMP cyclohydrolase [Aliidongia dinghuensis]GGF31103.1 bifunctional purine biosynthesis protein PurH [Aliidongia dinghuensis]
MTSQFDRPIRRALISVYDKTGLLPFARALAERGVVLISTGGSSKALADAGLAVTDVASVTGFPEMLDGRVKTLHPAIHGGILARRDLTAHRDALAKHDISEIDLVVCNLYPFEATVASGASWEDCIEKIDIGGPSLIRGAAKNHDFVTVVTDPADYETVLADLAANGGATTLKTRRKLAGMAYARTSAYDAAIAAWMAEERGETFPETLSIAGKRKQLLRYGENPHQEAAFYAIAKDTRPGVATATQLQGKELSYNNLNDTDAAFEAVAEFAEPAVAIIKHANPCGVALGTDLLDAYKKALACDPVSAFGGIIAVNRALDAATAEAVAALFAEVVIAPAVDDEAREILARKTQLRLLATGGMPDPAAGGMTFRSLSGGFLMQNRDAGRVSESSLQVVTKRAPTAAEMADLLFAFRVAKHVKSNAIVYAKGGATVGIGAGQMSRVDSSRIAAWKAAEAGVAAAGGDKGAKSPAIGSVVASDAFFPFADGLLAAAEAGATAVIQPGGSKRDAEVIAAADEKGLAMVFTGLRHFRH